MKWTELRWTKIWCLSGRGEKWTPHRLRKITSTSGCVSHKNDLWKWSEERLGAQEWVHESTCLLFTAAASSRRRTDDADSAAAVTFPHCHANIHRSLWPAVALSAAISATVWPPSRLSEQRRRRRTLSRQSRRSAATAHRSSHWTLQLPRQRDCAVCEKKNDLITQFIFVV